MIERVDTSMKVCIVTVYNSTNCGSYLQAYALKYVLEQMGAEVTFLETKVKNNWKLFLHKSIISLKHFNLAKIKFDYSVYRNFTTCLKKFELCPFEHKELSKQDVFILGSDEIWNVSRPIMRNSPIFWGKELSGKIISFAPSVNTSTFEDMERIEYVREALSSMYAISVRDNYSKKIISKYTDKKINVFCDPTFLLPMEEYEQIKGACPYKDFVLVYSAGVRFSEEDIINFKDFAKRNKKKLVSFPHRLTWCDYQSPAHPLDAIAYFMAADYVITDTFHGTALSLIFNKQFIAIPRGNTKVSEVLNYFEVPQLMKDNTEDLIVFFDRLNYSKEDLNRKIYWERQRAMEYLNESLFN